MKDFRIRGEKIEEYGDDLRALIRAFAFELHKLASSEEPTTDKEQLEFLKQEIEFILSYEVQGNEGQDRKSYTDDQDRDSYAVSNKD